MYLFFKPAHTETKFGNGHDLMKWFLFSETVWWLLILLFCLKFSPHEFCTRLDEGRFHTRDSDLDPNAFSPVYTWYLTVISGDLIDWQVSRLCFTLVWGTSGCISIYATNASECEFNYLTLTQFNTLFTSVLSAHHLWLDHLKWILKPNVNGFFEVRFCDSCFPNIFISLTEMIWSLQKYEY